MSHHTTTPQEREFYLLDSLVTDSDPATQHAYFTFFAGWIKNECLNQSELLTKMKSLAIRYPILRSRYIVRKNNVERIEIDNWAPDFASNHIVDCESVSSEVQLPPKVQEMVDVACRAPFGHLDTTRNGLIRVRLFTFGNSNGTIDSVLVVVCHHIVADLFGIAQIVSELLFETSSNANPEKTRDILSKSKQVDTQSNFDAANRQSNFDAANRYWNSLLSQTDYGELNAISDDNDVSGTSMSFILPPHFLHHANTLAETLDTSVFTVLLTSYLVFLASEKNDDEHNSVVCGAAVTLRDLSVAKMGSFSNIIPICWRDLSTSNEPSFEDLVKCIDKQFKESVAYKSTPFTSTGLSSQSPIRPRQMFGFQKIYTPGLADFAPHFMMEGGFCAEISGRQAWSVSVRETATPFEIALLMAQGKRDNSNNNYLVGRLQMRNSMLKRSCGDFNPAIEAKRMTESLEKCMIDLIIDKCTINHILNTYDDGGEGLSDGNETLGSLLHMACIEYRYRVMIECEQNKWTYGQAFDVAMELRAKLDGSQTVGVLVSHNELIVGLFIGWLAGACVCPLDPDSPNVRRDRLIEVTSMSIVLCAPEFTDLASKTIDLPIFELKLPSKHKEYDNHIVSKLDPTLPAYVLMTSGTSSGGGRCVSVSHESIINCVKFFCMYEKAVSKTKAGKSLSLPLPLPNGFRCSLWTHVHFDVGMLELLSPVLFHGGTCVVVPESYRGAANTYMEWLERIEKPISAAWIPPFFIHHMAVNKPRLPHLERLITGIESLKVSDLRAIARNHPNTTVLFGYGPTETAVFSTFWQCGVETDAGILGNAPIGYAISGTTIRLLCRSSDSDKRSVRDGEIVIGGIGVSKYIGEHTNGGFVIIDGKRYFRTGDRGKRLPDGSLLFLGRYDRQMKLHGFRIEPAEIENVLDQHDAVYHAVVASRNGVLTAVIELSPQSDRKSGVNYEAELIRYLSLHLPSYMIPISWALFDYGSFPTTVNGKCDWNVIDEQSRQELLKSSVDTPIILNEMVVQEVEQAILDNGGDVSEHSRPFLEAGLTSILLVSVYHQIVEHIPRLKFVDLFKYPNITALCQFLSDTTPSISLPLTTTITPTESIAIVGYDCVTPAGWGLSELWEALSSGRDCLSRIHLSHADNVWAIGALPGKYLSDFPIHLPVSEREVSMMDPQQKIWLRMCQNVLSSRDYCQATGVFCGVTPSTFLRLIDLDSPELLNSSPYRASILNANAADSIPARSAYVFDLRGPVVGVSTACSSSLVAVHLAIQSLRAGECYVALAGGISVIVPQSPIPGSIGSGSGSIYSSDGYVRPFSGGRTGTVVSNGGGVVVLQKLSDARSTSPNIHGVIVGSAVVNDGRSHAGFSAPSVEGQAKCIKLAHSNSQAEAETMWEAHGTSTLLGDQIELEGIKSAGVLSKKTKLSSVKSVIGHLNTAAGIAGLLACVLSLERGAFPARPLSLKKSDLEFPHGLEMSHNIGNQGPVSAAVSSFGIGGTNAHCVLKKWNGTCLLPKSTKDSHNDSECQRMWLDDNSVSPDLIIPPVLARESSHEINFIEICDTIRRRIYLSKIDQSVVDMIIKGHSKVIPLTLYVECLEKVVPSFCISDMQITKPRIVTHDNDQFWFFAKIASFCEIEMGFVQFDPSKDDLMNSLTFTSAKALLSTEGVCIEKKKLVNTNPIMIVGTDFYEWLESKGFSYGIEFRLLKDVALYNDGYFVGRVIIPRSSMDNLFILLDGILQVASAVVYNQDSKSELRLPTCIEKVVIRSEISEIDEEYIIVHGKISQSQSIIESLVCAWSKGRLEVCGLKFESSSVKEELESSSQSSEENISENQLLKIMETFVADSILLRTKALGDLIADSLVFFSLHDRLSRKMGRVPDITDLNLMNVDDLVSWYGFDEYRPHNSSSKDDFAIVLREPLNSRSSIHVWIAPFGTTGSLFKTLLDHDTFPIGDGLIAFQNPLCSPGSSEFHSMIDFVNAMTSYISEKAEEKQRIIVVGTSFSCLTALPLTASLWNLHRFNMFCVLVDPVSCPTIASPLFQPSEAVAAVYAIYTAFLGQRGLRGDGSVKQLLSINELTTRFDEFFQECNFDKDPSHVICSFLRSVGVEVNEEIISTRVNAAINDNQLTASFVEACQKFGVGRLHFPTLALLCSKPDPMSELTHWLLNFDFGSGKQSNKENIGSQRTGKAVIGEWMDLIAGEELRIDLIPSDHFSIIEGEPGRKMVEIMMSHINSS